VQLWAFSEIVQSPPGDCNEAATATWALPDSVYETRADAMVAAELASRPTILEWKSHKQERNVTYAEPSVGVYVRVYPVRVVRRTDGRE